MDGLKVWYDHKRGCYVSNAAFLYAKQIGIPAPIIAEYFCRLLERELPDLVEKAWVS